MPPKPLPPETREDRRKATKLAYEEKNLEKRRAAASERMRRLRTGLKNADPDTVEQYRARERLASRKKKADDAKLKRHPAVIKPKPGPPRERSQTTGFYASPAKVRKATCTSFAPSFELPVESSVSVAPVPPLESAVSVEVPPQALGSPIKLRNSTAIPSSVEVSAPRAIASGWVDEHNHFNKIVWDFRKHPEEGPCQFARCR
ncbi:hypothetical protein C8F01DRAFT_1095514 [Mycena amicta]|nr:hypothetical protein C8F01DRAFT_1095514 [Mycena amicta]